MSSDEKDPPTPEQVLAALPLDVLLEALAKASAQLQGKEGAELQQHVTEVKAQVQTLVRSVELDSQDHEARRAMAADVEKLLDVVAKTGTAAGDMVARHRAPLAQAFRGVPLGKVADGLELFASWLQDPSDAKAAQIKQLIAQLQHEMGSVAGEDPEREAVERRAAIKRDVQASLDKIFRGTPKKS